jgi:CheY-like chemotaxis protein
VAHSKEEADQRLRGRDFQVVLIDVRLPDTDGHELFRLVQRHLPDAHTVLITGYRGETEELVQKIIKEGADAVCYKPFDVPKLLETVASLSTHRRAAS